MKSDFMIQEDKYRYTSTLKACCSATNSGMDELRMQSLHALDSHQRTGFESMHDMMNL